jgi:sulfhydrogenase subunit beta (sulfur reductase)
VTGSKAGLTRSARLITDCGGLQQLIDTLTDRGYRVIGPTVRSGAIAYDTATRVEELPIGWTDRQEAGTYRLEKREDDAVFGYAVGPHSWKRFLHPPAEKLWQAQRGGDGFIVSACEQAPEPLAFIGVSACELHAIAIQDKVFVEGPYLDQRYWMRREQAFIVAVNCGTAGGTCFCVSMGTGPKVTAGFDLALTELLEDGPHLFMLEIGSAAGAEIARSLPQRAATAAEIEAADRVVARTRGEMARHIETVGLKEALQNNPEHPLWDEVADRCLACANCTMVCPTCFCTTVDDTTDLTGTVAERTRR